MHRRFIAGDFERRFVCLTFDDGYKDIMQLRLSAAQAIRDAVRAVSSPTSFPDRLGELWWLALEAVIAQNNRIGLVIDGKDRFFDCATLRGEARALRRGLWLSAQHEGRGRVARDGARPLRALRASIIAAFCRDLCMDWEELGELAADPLVHHRRAYRQPHDADEGRRRKRGARRNGHEPRRCWKPRSGGGRSIWPIRSAIRPRRARANSASPPSSASRPR